MADDLYGKLAIHKDDLIEQLEAENEHLRRQNDALARALHAALAQRDGYRAAVSEAMGVLRKYGKEEQAWLVGRLRSVE